MMFNFIKQKKIKCGDNFLEVDIYPRTRKQIDTPKGKRPKKKLVSKPSQKNLNDKNAKRYFSQLVKSNFKFGDQHVTLTYKEKLHPKSLMDAERMARNYISRVNYLRKKKGLPNAKYIIVTEYQLKNDTPIKIHHHIIIDGGLSRDEYESLWRLKKEKGKKVGEKIGRTQANILQPDENGASGLVYYLCKYEYRKKRWTSSTNLVKPFQEIHDHAWTKRQIEKIAKAPFDPTFWEKKFKGYKVAKDYGYEAKYWDHMGWSIYLKMYRVCDE